jgi:hypothetical protein
MASLVIDRFAKLSRHVDFLEVLHTVPFLPLSHLFRDDANRTFGNRRGFFDARLVRRARVRERRRRPRGRSTISENAVFHRCGIPQSFIKGLDIDDPIQVHTVYKIVGCLKSP